MRRVPPPYRKGFSGWWTADSVRVPQTAVLLLFCITAPTPADHRAQKMSGGGELKLNELRQIFT